MSKTPQQIVEIDQACSLAAPWNGRARPRKRSSTAFPIRKRTPTMWCASRRRNSPRFARSPASPDFAHLMIDYVPRQWLLESKSLKLYHRQLPQPRRIPRGLHGRNRQAHRGRDQAEMAAHRRLLVSARRHPHRCVLADRQVAEGLVDSRSGRRALPRAGMTMRLLVLVVAAAVLGLPGSAFAQATGKFDGAKLRDRNQMQPKMSGRTTQSLRRIRRRFRSGRGHIDLCEARRKHQRRGRDRQRCA